MPHLMKNGQKQKDGGLLNRKTKFRMERNHGTGHDTQASEQSLRKNYFRFEKLFIAEILSIRNVSNAQMSYKFAR